MGVTEKDVVLKNKYGLHARPATLLAEVANSFRSEILVTKEGQEVNEDGQPDGGLDGILGVAEQAGEVELALQPAEEEFDLPAPEVDLDDLGGGEIPAIGEDFVAAGGGGAVAGAEARGDVGRDQAPARQDDAGLGGASAGPSRGGSSRVRARWGGGTSGRG